MMDRAEAHQCGVADSVRDPGVANGGPERLVADRVRGAEADMRKAGDARVARAMIALTGGLGPDHELDRIAGWVLEADELAYATRVAVFARSKTHVMAKLFERSAGRVKVFPAAEFERHRLVVGIAFEVAERVGA